jgi:mannan endo-1,4-beta-mannosidase
MISRSCTLLVLASSALVRTALAAVPLVTRSTDGDADARGCHFVRRSGRQLQHRGKTFRIAGASNYYLMYSSPFMVDGLLTAAASSQFNVVRMWGSLEIGNPDGSNSIDGTKNGVYFQSWNGTEPAYNDGTTGLQHLDYVIYKAGLLGLKVIIPFVNNWNAFGGMDQYVRWKNGHYHDDFYTDPTIRQWFKNWIGHVLNRTNTYTGVKYKDDATIMAWDLANEPRCRAFGAYPQSSMCTTQTIVGWADDVSRYVKSIDKQHILSAGDEGFYCIAGATDSLENCSEGVDTLALADLPAMDAMSFHLYPDNWGRPASFGAGWIRRHIADGRKIHERVLMGEFGIQDKSIRNPLYKEWTDIVLADGGAGALYWMLSDKQDGGSRYPDFDGFTVYCPSPVCAAFTNFSKFLQNLPPFDLSPIADDDRAATQHDVAVTLSPLANDITYLGAALKPDTIDLDLTTPGQQAQLATSSGVYAARADGTIAFSPAPGFSGTASIPYTVSDDRRRIAHPASLIVDVKGDPNTLYSFEDGAQTWVAATFSANAGTTAQSTNFPTGGAHSLEVSATASGGWFGPALAPPLPLSLTASIHRVLLDITTTAAGTAQSVALQVGSDFHWCQTDFGYINASTSSTVTVDLAALFASVSACQGSLPVDTSRVQAIWVYFNGGTPSYLDNVRTE